MRPLLDLDFRTTYVDGGVLYTPATRGSGAVIERAVMGTGVPGNANAPVLTPAGALFDGNDYVNTLSLDLMQVEAPRTIVARGRFLPMGASYEALLSNYDTSNGYGFNLWVTASIYPYMRLQAGSAITGAGTLRERRPSTIAMAYDGSRNGSGIVTSTNGEFVTAGVGSMPAGVMNSAAAYVIGGAWSAGNVLRDFVVSGTTLRRFQVYPFAMTPAQVRAVHERFEREGES